MTYLNRRTFLKIVGIAGASVLGGCTSESPRKLVPYIASPDNSIPGEPSWFAATCRECPAGCGLIAKNRDGRVIKVEGNPDNPVNMDALCPRGQASLNGLYNPDRFRGPMLRTFDNTFSSVTWRTAEAELAGILDNCLKEGRGDKIAFISDRTDDSLKDLIKYWL